MVAESDLKGGGGYIYNLYRDLYSLSLLGYLGIVEEGDVREEARASASDTRGDGVVNLHPPPLLTGNTFGRGCMGCVSVIKSAYPSQLRR